MNTRGSALLLGVAALALLAQVSTALGAGQITGLSLSLPGIKTCVVETVTVRGTGKCCGNWSVHYGDGGAVIALGPKACLTFPAKFHYTYSKMGTYTVSADASTFPGSICKGKASATVQVAAGPWITSTSFFSLGAQITPGAVILLYGQNFGDTPGQVWIHLKDYQGNASHHQLLYTDTHWSDTFVAGTIPEITKVLNQQATLTVVAQCGAVSNAAAVEFTANLDVADLAQHTDRLACSISPGAGVSDQCMNWGGSHWPPECGAWPGQGGTLMDPGLGGYHASGWGFHEQRGQ
jgi:hypothetical protein